MFDKWLRPQDVEQPNGLLEYQLLADEGLIEDGELVERLGHEVMRNYLAPGELANVFDDLGAPEVAGYLRKNKFPVDRKIRHGDFGEIVTGALYRRVRRWCVPLLKLRYKQTPAQAVQGTDVLAFRFRQDPPAIAVPEVKTRASRDNRVGTEAYDSLEKVVGRLDESIHFLMAHCSNRGQVFLARRLGALLRPGAPRRVERHMLFVHDAKSWKEDIVAGLSTKVTERTELTVVKIDDLKEFIGQVYDAAETAPGNTTSRSTDNGTAGTA
ncbi:Hachiman antiphage defense system protein HamA [Streptomyces sp. NPDC091212]|uniref:Hachiman antiphage defense system protein HamA n=1 Tax=Streptomyces sp. NPDC091212 TaxID=3155191 RepID=UPI0034483D21